MTDDIKEMLDGNYENEELFYKVTDYLAEKENEDGFNKLSEVEKNLFMVGQVLMEVNNGGFDQYFLNTDGEHARDNLNFFNLINEITFSSLLNKAVNVFESDMTDDEKYDEFDEIDSEFYELDGSAYEDLYDKCINYLENNLS